MVTGLIAGAAIFIAGLITGFWLCDAFQEETFECVESKEKKDIPAPIIESEKKNPTELFRTSKGLLSYKKYVRS